MLRSLQQFKSGFTLIETIVATSILIVIVIVSLSFIIQGTRIEDFLSQQSAAVASAEKAITRMTSVIRETADGGNGGYAIVEATNTEFTFYSDVDADESAELVRYYLDGTNLIESIIEPSEPPIIYNDALAVERVLSSYVVNQSEYSNNIFTYYNGDYPDDVVNNPLTEPLDITDITLVQIHFDVNVNPTRIPDTDSVETFIQLRNLKTNL